MTVLALLTDATPRARLADALKGAGVAVEYVVHVRDARARLAAGSVRALVVAAHDGERCAVAPFVGEVRRGYPHVTVVAYCAAGAGMAADIVALVTAGAHALVVRDIDDERHALRVALRAAEQQSAAALVLEGIRGVVPSAVVPLLELYLRAERAPPTVAQAAARLGVHRKTLVNRMATAGCPPPRVLRTWCRLFVAARLLEEPGRTVESVAMQLDFDSTTGLRNMMKRYTGRSAREVRAAGGLACVLTTFVADCRRRAVRLAASPDYTADVPVAMPRPAPGPVVAPPTARGVDRDPSSAASSSRRCGTRGVADPV